MGRGNSRHLLSQRGYHRLTQVRGAETPSVHPSRARHCPALGPSGNFPGSGDRCRPGSETTHEGKLTLGGGT